jgi:hypothetical protein
MEYVVDVAPAGERLKERPEAIRLRRPTERSVKRRIFTLDSV